MMRIYVVGFVLWLLTASCVTTEVSTQPITTTQNNIFNSSTFPGQISAPVYIQSIRLAPIRHPDAIPVLELGSEDKIVLEFDELSNQPSSFVVEIEHRDPDWNTSLLLPRDYLRYNYSDRFSSGTLSASQVPSYYHYRYTFPSPSLDVALSGNYVLNIKDASNGRILFNLPFFVTESLGNIKTTVIEMPRAANNALSADQIEVDFDFPDTLTRFPSTDFQARILQDHFWGNIKSPNQVDISKQGHIRYFLGRNQWFIRPYEVRSLELDLKTLNYYSYQPEQSPPLIMLAKDYIDDRAIVSPEIIQPFGRPRSDRSARYFEVQFNVDVPSMYSRDSIVVLGSFNQWKPSINSQLTYDAATGSYIASALVKEGEWQYKYAIIKNNRLDDHRLDHPFSRSRRVYTTFVYYKAFGTSYYRLINSISSRSSQ